MLRLWGEGKRTAESFRVRSVTRRRSRLRFGEARPGPRSVPRPVRADCAHRDDRRGASGARAATEARVPARGARWPWRAGDGRGEPRRSPGPASWIPARGRAFYRARIALAENDRRGGQGAARDAGRRARRLRRADAARRGRRRDQGSRRAANRARGDRKARSEPAGAAPGAIS